MSSGNLLRTLLCIGLSSVSFASGAEIFSVIEPKPISELWLNPGLYSYHFQKNKGLSNSNFGLGGEYRYSTVNSVTLGIFENSVRQSSRYAGWYWQPLGLGSIRFGAVAGAIDGYPKMRNGGLFFAVIPTVSIESKNIGANLMVIPSYQDKIYGTVSLQLKLRLF